MITITATGIREVIANLRKLQDGLEHPKEGLLRSTHAVAGVFAKNYDEQGSAVGGWADLSEQTLAMREWQGFDPGPIMYRYGALRDMAVAFFQRSTGGSESKGDSYSDNVTTATLDIEDNKAALSLGGSYKVLNQFGYPNTNGSGENPARPFWFINSDTIVAGRDAMEDWIKDEVLP